MDYETINSEELEKFNNECKNGNLEEVKRLLERYDFLSYFKKIIIPEEKRSERERRVCHICICIKSGANEVLFELLNRRFKPHGYCSLLYSCSLEEAIKMKNSEAIEALIMKSVSWKYIENVGGLCENKYAEEFSKLLYFIIQKNGNGVNFKPAKG